MHIKVTTIDDGTLGKMNKLINTVESIATKSPTPSPYKVEFFPISEIDGYEIHIRIGSEPKGREGAYERWEDFVERVMDTVNGQIKEWSINVIYRSIQINTRLDELIDMLERMDYSFYRPSSIWSRKDIDKVAEILIDA